MKILNIKYRFSLRSFSIRHLQLGLLMGLLQIHSAYGETAMLDRIVAIVDSDVVLASELEQQTQQVLVGIRRAGHDAPPLEELQREVLNKLIVENIQVQMANRAGVRINDAQLNQAMLRIAQQNGMDLNQFRAALEADGLSYTATRERIRKEMTINRVQQGSVNSRVQISEQEIANFLNSEEGSALTAPEYRMLHTLVPLPSGADSADIAKAKAYAEKLQARITAGEDYLEVVNGKHPYKLAYSDLGWRKTADLPSLLTAAATELREGQTAAPIQSPSGFHLVKLAETRGVAETIPQTQARHILLKPSTIRNAQETAEQIAALRERILKGEDFAELARTFSEDIGSAQEGGDLGWTNPGQLVESFQQAMDNTAINTISEPFQSPYGWHIVQVLDRRQQDVTADIRKNIARNYIHKRKFDDELQAWLQKIRDEAFVDIKI